jgi:hypothetical protein
MDRDEIEVDHCYSMTPIKGRRTIARVTNLFRITAVAAYQESGTETLELNHTPLTRQGGRVGGGNCCSMSLCSLRKRKLPAPNNQSRNALPTPLPAALVR